MPISAFLKANVQRLRFYQKLKKLNSLSIPSGVASLLMPLGGSTTHHGNARTCLKHKSSKLECYEERFTSSVWLENELILIELLKVSEVATNHWVFSKVWLVI